MKAVKARLGGTVNDVVLAVVSGAVRRDLAGRGVDVDRLDFRAMIPVNLRAGYDGAGNRVASVVARLPVDEPDAHRRLARVSREMDAVKRSHQVDAARALEDIADWSFTTLISQTTRLATLSQPFNLVVTNVPGPQFPLYFLGARLVECYPVVPIFHYQALGIALFSYDGRLFWGFNADWDALPDLHALVGLVDEEIRELAASAALDRAREPRPDPHRRPAMGDSDSVDAEAGHGDPHQGGRASNGVALTRPPLPSGYNSGTVEGFRTPFPTQEPTPFLVRPG